MNKPNVWEQVKENQAKLNSCQQHKFSIDVTPNQSWNKQYECEHCGGYVPVQAKRWYEMGVTHEKARAAYE